MAENNNQPRPQGQKNGGYQNRNRNYQNKNRSSKNNRPQQNNNAQTQPQNQNGEEQHKQQNRGAHKPYNRSKNHNNRFEGRRLPAIETVEDIAADISRIEKEIELEIKEIGTMTLG